ncbi:hypothetical protein, partial [uncultured Wocania sp.]|uniref:hypothetical protein n=1 Tax=uncultured Wocania sp. TaxID=2834404 RepID=UPI0030F78FBA
MRRKIFLGSLSFFIITISIFALNRKEVSINKPNLTVSSSVNKLLPPSATISGTTQVCKDETPLPQITFTGAAGTTPYTFTYSINAGANQTITTVGTNNSVTLPVSTN